MNFKDFDKLNERQKHKFKNIIASADIEGTPVSDDTKELIIQQMLGLVSPNEAAQTIIDRHTKS